MNHLWYIKLLFSFLFLYTTASGLVSAPLSCLRDKCYPTLTPQTLKHDLVPPRRHNNAVTHPAELKKLTPFLHALKLHPISPDRTYSKRHKKRRDKKWGTVQRKTTQIPRIQIQCCITPIWNVIWPLSTEKEKRSILTGSKWVLQSHGGVAHGHRREMYTVSHP